MAHGHGERLSAADIAFLRMESRTLFLHSGGLFVFDPPREGAPEFARLIERVRSRLHLVPRYRQRLARPLGGLGGPVWVDDTDFDLSYHVRHAALPRPGTLAQLTEYAARILSRPLDRSRPLWELYHIEGLADGRLALLAKSHHAVVDEVAGVDIATVILDLAPELGDAEPEPRRWEPEPTPSPARLAVDSAAQLATSPTSLVEQVRHAARAPRTAARRALDLGVGVASVARTNLADPPPRSLLNRPPGPHRRLAVQRLPLDEVKDVKDVFRTTVNDVVLTLVADATGRYLRSRGAPTDRLWLRALVPHSTREDADEHPLGSRVVGAFADLPVFEMDPAERLHVCHQALADLKASHHAVGARFLVELTGFAPPTLHAMAARVGARSRLFNFLVTNAPGPQVPVYCLGARLSAAYPFAPLTPNQCYSVSLTSVDGNLDVGVTADYDALPGIEAVGDHLADGLAELRRHADAAAARGRRMRAETVAGQRDRGGAPPRDGAGDS